MENKNKTVHILVKTATKKKLNNVRNILELESPNRISNDEIINLLLNFYVKNTK